MSDINEVTKNMAEEVSIQDKTPILKEFGKLKSTKTPEADVTGEDDRKKKSTNDNRKMSILDMLLRALDSTNDSKLAFDNEIKSSSEAKVKKSKVKVYSIFKC